MNSSKTGSESIDVEYATRFGQFPGNHAVIGAVIPFPVDFVPDQFLLLNRDGVNPVTETKLGFWNNAVTSLLIGVVDRGKILFGKFGVVGIAQFLLKPCQQDVAGNGAVTLNVNGGDRSGRGILERQGHDQGVFTGGFDL